MAANWQDVQKRKAEMRARTLSQLSDAEKEVLSKVLELEWENRHLKTPEIKQPLKNFIDQVVK